jgi:hypothetical protein
MPSYVVSGRMAILFDRIAVPLEEAEGGNVTAFRCRWCGFTYVVEEPKQIPDHECRGPSPQAGGTSAGAV